MNIEISNEAVNWFEKNLSLETFKGIRFFPKLTRGTDTGISVGIEVTEPKCIGVKKEINQVTYFIEESDEWLFDYKDVHIILDKELQEPKYLTNDN